MKYDSIFFETDHRSNEVIVCLSFILPDGRQNCQLPFLLEVYSRDALGKGVIINRDKIQTIKTLGQFQTFECATNSKEWTMDTKHQF